MGDGQTLELQGGVDRALDPRVQARSHPVDGDHPSPVIERGRGEDFLGHDGRGVIAGGGVGGNSQLYGDERG